MRQTQKDMMLSLTIEKLWIEIKESATVMVQFERGHLKDSSKEFELLYTQNGVYPEMIAVNINETFRKKSTLHFMANGIAAEKFCKFNILIKENNKWVNFGTEQFEFSNYANEENRDIDHSFDITFEKAKN